MDSGELAAAQDFLEHYRSTMERSAKPYALIADSTPGAGIIVLRDGPRLGRLRAASPAETLTLELQGFGAAFPGVQNTGMSCLKLGPQLQSITQHPSLWRALPLEPQASGAAILCYTSS